MSRTLREAIQKLADDWEADAESMGELIPEGEVLEYGAETLRGLLESSVSEREQIAREIEANPSLSNHRDIVRWLRSSDHPSAYGPPVRHPGAPESCRICPPLGDS